MKPAEFGGLFDECPYVREWAVANCATMDDVWATARPDWLVWVSTRRGVLDDRTLRLFAVWCARQVQHLTTDPRSLAALDVAERHADGEATDDELDAARAAALEAWYAAGASARDAAGAARYAAWAAARAAALDAAWDAAGAARAATWSAAWAAVDAARAGARVAADAAAWDAWDARAAWLRANAKPDWARALQMGGAR